MSKEIVLHSDRSVAAASEFASHVVREAELVLTRYCAANPAHRYTAPAEYHQMLHQARDAEPHTTGVMIGLMIELETGL